MRAVSLFTPEMNTRRRKRTYTLPTGFSGVKKSKLTMHETFFVQNKKSQMLLKENKPYCQ